MADANRKYLHVLIDVADQKVDLLLGPHPLLPLVTWTGRTTILVTFKSALKQEVN